MARHPQHDNEPYSDEEAQRRFVAAVKAGLKHQAQASQECRPEGRPGTIEETAQRQRDLGIYFNPSHAPIICGNCPSRKKWIDDPRYAAGYRREQQPHRRVRPSTF